MTAPTKSFEVVELLTPHGPAVTFDLDILLECRKATQLLGGAENRALCAFSASL